MRSVVERCTGLAPLLDTARRLEESSSRSPDLHATSVAWLAAACDWLGLDLDMPVGDIDRVPSGGAVLVAAEHPTGAMEGMLLLSLLVSRRRDVKVLANRWLAGIPALRHLVIPVDVFAEHNGAALRQAVSHLRAGGLLLAFPAGEVARGRWFGGRPQEGRWRTAFAGLQRLGDAPVVPVHIGARAPRWIERLGALHPLLRTALLPRALLGQRGARVVVRCGHTIAPSQLERFGGDDRARADYLRLRTEILARRVLAVPPVLPIRAAGQPTAGRDSAERLAALVANLPASCHLLTANGMQVFCILAHEAPGLVREIGRLRELTFRLVGEGSGRELDLDEFDASYRHLFVWDPAACEIVGSYRIGPSDELRAHGGDAALYSSRFYSFGPPFWQRVSPALELGRSFVQPSYQKGFAPLLLLWRGIGTFVARHPRYRYVFGMVSISADHHATSVRLMVEHLRSHCLATELAPFVRSRSPWRAAPREQRSLRWQPQQIADLRGVSAMVRDLEVGRPGIPVLLEQYLKLGAKLLGVNVDPAFHTIDALVVVDLLAAPAPLQQRYLGVDGVRALRDCHGDAAAAGA